MVAGGLDGGVGVAGIRGSGMVGYVAVGVAHGIGGQAASVTEWQQRCLFLNVAAAEVEATKWQKIMISWQLAVWLIENRVGRPLNAHLQFHIVT